MIVEATAQLARRLDLSASSMEETMEEIMSGKAHTEEIVSFLTALADKGETVSEIAAAVSVMRRFATAITVENKVILDTCGTGGDTKGTFNVSTIVAFVASGAGVTVAKHGNRSVSSRSGSADILEAAGVNIRMGRDAVKQCLESAGIAFLFAPDFHPAMQYAMAARRQMGRRTIFNILGPLTNPAGATHQLVGVFSSAWTQKVASVLAALGTVHAMVVYGKDGLDEITTTAQTQVSEVFEGAVRNYEITPEEFGFKRARLSDLEGGSPRDNARILLEVLGGQEGFARDIVLLNAAAALCAADRAASIPEGIALAKESIDAKKALEKFELLRDLSHGHSLQG